MFNSCSYSFTHELNDCFDEIPQNKNELDIFEGFRDIFGSGGQVDLDDQICSKFTDCLEKECAPTTNGSSSFESLSELQSVGSSQDCFNLEDQYNGLKDSKPSKLIKKSSKIESSNSARKEKKVDSKKEKRAKKIMKGKLISTRLTQDELVSMYPGAFQSCSQKRITNFPEIFSSIYCSKSAKNSGQSNGSVNEETHSIVTRSQRLTVQSAYLTNSIFYNLIKMRDLAKQDLKLRKRLMRYENEEY